MTDDVNNPTHYNKQGIEVIDVIEAYTPNSPHLANVLKYVCRHSYKGTPVKDLKKAAWYLHRAITLAVYEQDLADIEAENCEWVGPGYSERDVEVFFEGYECRKQEEDEAGPETGTPIPESWDWSSSGVDFRPFGNGQDFEEPVGSNDHQESCQEWDYHWPASLYPLKPGDKGYTEEPPPPTLGSNPYANGNPFAFVTTSADRIAGDDDAAKRIKGEYYDFDRFEIKGYCAYCDAEIGVTQPFVHGGGFESGIIFCSMTHMDELKKWQGR